MIPIVCAVTRDGHCPAVSISKCVLLGASI